VGHSFGGRIAIKLASQSPSYLTSLILVDSAGLDHRSRDTSITIGFAKLVAPLFKPSFMQPLRKKLYALIGSDDYVASQYIKDTFINIVNESLDQYLPLISTRTLIIWGEQDDNSYTPPSDAQVMQEKIAKSQVVILPGAGHYSFMDRPKEFAEALTNFLKKP
jgi:pimeloyl-ACP methyl ester carboxylesterase